MLRIASDCSETIRTTLARALDISESILADLAAHDERRPDLEEIRRSVAGLISATEALQARIGPARP